MKIEVKPQQRPTRAAGQIWKRTAMGAYNDHYYLVVVAPNAFRNLVMVDLQNMEEYWGKAEPSGSEVSDDFEFVGTLKVTL